MTTVRGIDAKRLAEVRRQEDERFVRERPRSHALLEAARRVMPAGVPMGWMAGVYRHPTIFAVAGSGAHFTDADGHRYLDMNQVDLSMTCGFDPAPVVEAVRRRIAEGASFLLPTEDAIAVATLLGERHGLPRWQFTLSASTANIEAIRLARVATGRARSLVFDGRYHGLIEETSVHETSQGAEAEVMGLAVKEGSAARVVPFNDLGALERALKPGDIACVITEPALTNIGLVLPEPGFLHGVRELAHRHGALLAIDETHTQTMAYGGPTRAWNLEPDIVTLGKSLGGGIAIGAYGVTPRLAELMERHLLGDTGGHGLGLGGTLHANALSMAAARAVLEGVMTPAAFDRVDRLGARLAAGIEAAIKRHGLPWRATRLGGRVGHCLEPDLPRNGEDARRSIVPDLIDARRVFMANRGVWEAIITAGPAASFAHTESDVDTYLVVVEDFLDAIAG
jgi:glutamate-1-semialdehyde 2,1-aminomutase